MRKYMVNVNGVNYEVMVEEITGGAASAPVAAAPAKPAAPVSSAPAGGESITAPMPGNILSVNVKAGDVIKAGAVAMVLEAMKMENEIMAPVNGTVKAVNVSAGATVNTGDVLLVIG